MRSPFPTHADLAIFEYCSEMPCREELRLGPDHLSREIHFVFKPQPWSWIFAARVMAYRIAHAGILLAAIPGVPLALLSCAALCPMAYLLTHAGFPSAGSRIDGLSRRFVSIVSCLMLLSDDCLFCFDPVFYGRYCYQRLACFWTKALCHQSPQLHFLPPDLTRHSPRLVSGALDMISRSVSERGVGRAKAGWHWRKALANARITPADFDQIDRFWARSNLPLAWTPEPCLPGYAHLRLACSVLSETLDAEFRPSADRARAALSSHERRALLAALSEKPQPGEPARGAQRL